MKNGSPGYLIIYSTVVLHNTPQNQILEEDIWSRAWEKLCTLFAYRKHRKCFARLTERKCTKNHVSFRFQTNSVFIDMCLVGKRVLHVSHNVDWCKKLRLIPGICDDKVQESNHIIIICPFQQPATYGLTAVTNTIETVHSYLPCTSVLLQSSMGEKYILNTAPIYNDNRNLTP